MAVAVDTSRTLRQYSTAWITLICRHCPHRKEMLVAELAQRVGWDTVIERPRRFRLRCSKCGNKEPALTVGYDDKPRGYTATGH